MPRTNYDPKKWTWGYELEVGDVPRKLIIPDKLGAWEYAETDVVNLRDPYKYIAADPLGLEPPVGGEINTYPTKSINGQLDKLKKLILMFGKFANGATISKCVMEAHIHVRVPGLRDDMPALKRLTKYIKNNQQTVVDKCVQYVEHPLMKETKTARTYLKWDMGRQMPTWMADNIKKAVNFDDFIRIQCCGKDGVSRGRPFRYTVNTYCLKHTDTIEFRCFRASLDLSKIRHCFFFVKHFMNAALNGGRPAVEILNRKNYKFPPFIYNHAEYQGWEATKWDKSRGKKKRMHVQIS